VTYSDVYQFLTCLGVNPCWGWLNTDPYWRNQTTFRAFELNAVLVNVLFFPLQSILFFESTLKYDNLSCLMIQITRNYKPKNFDLTYFDSPINGILDIFR
jgi:hypothetical protein